MIQYRFGKHAPKQDYRTLKLKNYLMASLEQPPASLDVLSKVYTNVNEDDPTKLFPIDGNDKLGDCTIAAVAHAITVFNGLIGKLKILSEIDVIKLYMSLSGGKDSGLNELQVLNYWQSNDVAGDKIIAFAKIDEKNHTHIKQAIQLFGGVYLGFQVQQNCIDDFNAGKAWTAGRLTNEGHAVYVVGYDDTGVTVLTWGNIQKATWDWWDACVDEAYAILPSQASEVGFAIGFDFEQLKSDLNEVAN